MKSAAIKIIASALLAVCASCFARGSAAEGKAQKKLDTREIVIEKQSGGSEALKVEVARTEAERAAGLMFRRSLAEGEGMLFVFESDKILSFWMKNTSLSLSIAYIDRDGIIKEIHPLEPFSTEIVRSSRSLRYALEVPRDYFSARNITAGDKVRGIK